MKFQEFLYYINIGIKYFPRNLKASPWPENNCMEMVMKASNKKLNNSILILLKPLYIFSDNIM